MVFKGCRRYIMVYSLEDVKGSYISLDVTDPNLNVTKIKELVDSNVRFDFISAKNLDVDDVNGVRALV